MYCLSRRLGQSIPFSFASGTPRAAPVSSYSEEGSDLFLSSKTSRRRRHRWSEWRERLNTPPRVMTLLIVITVHLVRSSLESRHLINHNLAQA